ncbi:MAG: hypothetical protein IJE72_01730 [Clostridia bacterium]|nr:hypothetical protein [Clostridia bacterium]
MSSKNILTGLVCIVALVLVVVVILVKTGALDGTQKTTEMETIIETSVVYESQTNEEGSVEYVTWVHTYPKPKYSSNHKYPTTKRKTTVPRSTETTTAPFVEQSSFVAVTDENGIPQFDENGVPFTELITYTVPADSLTTTEPTTEFVPRTDGVVVTNRWGKTETDENGNPITEIVTLDTPPTTKADIWSENVQTGTTKKGILNIEPEVKRDDSLAQAVVDQLNADREAAGLPALEHVTALKATARTNSMSLALPDVYGEPTAPGAYTLVTTYGGNPVYQTVKAANNGTVMSADTTQIGVGVVVYEGKYYTTVIFN